MGFATDFHWRIASLVTEIIIHGRSYFFLYVIGWWYFLSFNRFMNSLFHLYSAPLKSTGIHGSRVCDNIGNWKVQFLSSFALDVHQTGAGKNTPLTQTILVVDCIVSQPDHIIDEVKKNSDSSNGAETASVDIYPGYKFFGIWICPVRIITDGCDPVYSVLLNEWIMNSTRVDMVCILEFVW